MTLKLKQGTVWIANLNPTKGTEPGKRRPVLVLQNQVLLDIGHPCTLIIPFTTQLIENAEPLRIRVVAREKLEQDSDLLIDQIRSIDNKRLTTGPLAQLDDELMKRIYRSIQEVMGKA